MDAHYPSPTGPTRWDVDPAAWRDVVACCPQLAVWEEIDQFFAALTERRR